MTSPRPTPKFYTETQTFSTKKARATPRDQAPPKPPVKSCPPVSRIFNNIVSYKARAISFKESDINLSNKHYDEDAKELYFEQCFEIRSKLGAGSFGEVFEVRSKEDGKLYAVKRSRERFRGESDRTRKLEEVKKHEELPKHPNCIKFIKAWEERQHLYIQTELCSTSLSNYSEMNHDIPETLIWKYLVDLLQAVKHLHDHELLHLDIKPDNIFISSDGICKLGDFGLVIDLNKIGKFEVLEGDPKYLAPEVLDGHFTKAADIFSLGITILELACDLDLPRGGDSWQTLRRGQIPEDMCANMSQALKSVILLMMEPNFRRRSTAAQILKIPQVRKVHKKRSWELKMKLMVSATICVLSFLWVQVITFGENFVKPFIWLKTKCVNTTKGLSTPLNYTRKQKPSDWHGWDGSFSDDEVLDEDMNHSRNNSLGVAPLSDTSTSDESNNGSFFLSSIPLRINNSTPASVKQRSSLRRTLMPCRLIDPIPFNFNEQKNSVNNMGNSPFSLKVPMKSSSRKFDSSARRDAAFVNKSPPVEPRNLMNLFDEANKDDNDTT